MTKKIIKYSGKIKERTSKKEEKFFSNSKINHCFDCGAKRELIY